MRGRGAPSGGERERIARRERCGRVGFRVQYASRGSRRVACGFIGGAVRRGKRERQRKVQNALDGSNLACGVSGFAHDVGMGMLDPLPSKLSVGGLWKRRRAERCTCCARRM